MNLGKNAKLCLSIWTNKLTFIFVDVLRPTELMCRPKNSLRLVLVLHMNLPKIASILWLYNNMLSMWKIEICLSYVVLTLCALKLHKMGTDITNTHVRSHGKFGF